MSKPKPLVHGQFYHIYNRGNNREDIFKEERNYEYFARLLRRHVLPIADVYAYCFLINHFHLLVRIRAQSELDATGQRSRAHPAPSQQFGNWFNAYAKSMNLVYERTGSLFQRPFGRRHVRSRAYFTTLVKYIHLNPQSHGLIDRFEDWPHSSFGDFVATDTDIIERATVVQLFGGLAAFHAAHEQASTDQQKAIEEPAVGRLDGGFQPTCQ